jgi:hypothetical protein
MENLTELLKESTSIKKTNGNIAAIEYIKELLLKNNLQEKEAVKCLKKLASFIKTDKTISDSDSSNYFLNIIKDRIIQAENVYEITFFLSEFYFDKKQFQLSFNMINGAISSINPSDFLYLHKLRNCYNKTADIALHLIPNEKDRSSEYLFRITVACILEIASELNRGFKQEIKVYKNNGLHDNIYLYDSEKYFDTALKAIGQFERKNEIINNILNFILIDLANKFENLEKLSNENISPIGDKSPIIYDDAQFIIDFSRELY